MNLKLRLRILLGIALVAGLAGGVAIQRVKAQRIRTPMLIQTEVQHVDADGSFKTTAILTEATRSDGSWVQDVLVPSQNAAARSVAILATREILYYTPRAGVRTVMHFNDVLYQRYAGPIPNDCLLSHPGPGNQGTCVDEGASILGYHVLKATHVYYPNTDGKQEKIEEMVAPDLDWKTISYRRYRAGALMETRVARYVVVGEPAPGLFVVPQDLPLVDGKEYKKMMTVAH